MSRVITGYLDYNPRTDRMGILVSDLWEVDGLHCGECLDVWDSNRQEWKSDRIEYSMDDEWYLVYSGLKGDSLRHIRVRYK